MESYGKATSLILRSEILVLRDKKKKKEKKMWSIIRSKKRTSSTNFYNFIPCYLHYSLSFLSPFPLFFLLSKKRGVSIITIRTRILSPKKKTSYGLDPTIYVSREVIFRSGCYQITLFFFFFFRYYLFHFSTRVKFALFSFGSRSCSDVQFFTDIITTKLFRDILNKRTLFPSGRETSYTHAGWT